MNDNPIIDVYAPPVYDDVTLPNGTSISGLSTSRTSIQKTFAVWTFVVSVSAIPGFCWGLAVTNSHYGAMLCGVVTFIVLYVGGDLVTRGSWWRKNRMIRRTLKIGYWTRMAISTVIPIGFYIDVYAGMLADLILGSRLKIKGGGDDLASFVGVYVMTLLTAAILNFVLFAYMLMLAVLQKAFTFIRTNKS